MRLRFLRMFAFVSLAGLLSACMTDSARRAGPEGDARVAVKLRKTGSLGKATVIEMDSLHLVASADDEESREASIPISGYAQQTVTETFEDLASGKTWTLTAVAKDVHGVEIYGGTTTFTVSPGETENVVLDLAAQYTMLKAMFYPIRDSVTTVELAVDGSVVLTSSFAKQSRVGDTALLEHDYLPASPSGESQNIRLDVYGDWNGVHTLLYRGDTTLSAVSGENGSYDVLLSWVGPGSDTMAHAEMVVTLGAVSTTWLNGYLEELGPVHWHIPPAASFNPGFSSDLVLGDDGWLWAVYGDEALGGKTTVVRSLGGGWEDVGAPGFSPDEVYQPSIAVDSLGTAYVAFVDVPMDWKLTVMRWDGTAWDTLGNRAFSPGQAQFPSIAVNGEGVPHVAYREVDDEGKIRVKRWNGTEWENVGSYVSAAEGSEPTIRFDAAGVAYVAFGDYANDVKPTVKRWNGTAWENVGSPGFANVSGSSTFLALDRDGIPYVVLSDDWNGALVRVFRWNGSLWQSVGAASASPGAGEFPVMTFDTANVPHVAYKDMNPGYKASVKRWTGTDWLPVGRLSFSAQEVSGMTLAINPDNVPFIISWTPETGGDLLRYTTPYYGYP